jgi:hypothetical protein
MSGMYRSPERGKRALAVAVIMGAICLAGLFLMAFAPGLASMLLVCGATATFGTLVFFKLFE